MFFLEYIWFLSEVVHSFMQEMYRQGGGQLQEELQHHSLRSSQASLLLFVKEI